MERAGGAWCPKQQVERGVREYLQIDFETVHMITGVQTQGRYDHGRGQEYAEEYTLEYWRPGMDQWKQYNRWDGKQVFYLFYTIQGVGICAARTAIRPRHAAGAIDSALSILHAYNVFMFTEIRFSLRL